MAGLESLTGDDPSGSESPTQGDNRIRELTQKTKESMSKEHTLSGIHAILSGTSTARPAAGNKGRLYILENPSVAKELQYDNGSSWETITKNQTVIDQIATLSAHISSNPADHADGSIKSKHLATGILAKKHFSNLPSFANNNDSVVKLIDGSELDSTWHTHPEPTSASGMVTLNSVTEFVTGKSNTGVEVTGPTVFTFSNAQVPDGAVAVILEGWGKITLQDVREDVIYTPSIKIRKDTSSQYRVLVGGYVGYSGTWDYGIYSLGWNGQGLFPVTTDKKIQYLVEGFNIKWGISIVGYI